MFYLHKARSGAFIAVGQRYQGETDPLAAYGRLSNVWEPQPWSRPVDVIVDGL